MFDTKATLLRFTSVGTTPAKYSWQAVRSVWLHGEQTGRTNIFAKRGIGTAGTLFTLCRLGDITLGYALLWRGSHYFLTSAEQKNPVTAEIAAAKVRMSDCVATRPQKQKDESGKIKNVQMPLVTFPAVMTEKYLGSMQQTPQTVQEATMILITHKAIKLKAGDLVTVKDITYTVSLCHLQGEWANEYEIVNTSEV